MASAAIKQNIIETAAREYIKTITAIVTQNIPGLTVGAIRHQDADRITFYVDFYQDACLVEDYMDAVTAAVGVVPETFVNQNGEQATWDFGGHRIAFYDRFCGDGEISLMPDPNIE